VFSNLATITPNDEVFIHSYGRGRKQNHNSLDEQLVVEFHGPMQIEFEELNDFQLKFHLSFFREVVGLVVFQYVHVPKEKKNPRFSKYQTGDEKVEKHGNRRLPVHRPLDDGVVQRVPDVSGVFARQQPTVNIGREEVQVVGRLERQ